MDRQNNLTPIFSLTLVPPRFVVTACYSQVAYKNECAHRLQKLQNETGINKQFQLLVLGRGVESTLALSASVDVIETHDIVLAEIASRLARATRQSGVGRRAAHVRMAHDAGPRMWNTDPPTAIR